MRLNDDARRKGFTHRRDSELDLEPGRVVVIDFQAERGEIVLL